MELKHFIIISIISSSTIILPAKQSESVKPKITQKGFEEVLKLIEAYRKEYPKKFKEKDYEKENEKYYGFSSPGMVNTSKDLDALKYLIEQNKNAGNKEKAEMLESYRGLLDNQFELTKRNAQAIEMSHHFSSGM